MIHLTQRRGCIDFVRSSVRAQDVSGGRGAAGRPEPRPDSEPGGSPKSRRDQVCLGLGWSRAQFLPLRKPDTLADAPPRCWTQRRRRHEGAAGWPPGRGPACPAARPAARRGLPRSPWRAPSARWRRTPARHSSRGWLPARHNVSTVGKRQKDHHPGRLAASVPSERDTTHKRAGVHLHGDGGGMLGHAAVRQVDGRCARARAECHRRRRAPAVNGRCCGRMRGSGGMMRPGAGSHFAGQHGHSGKPGGHPHPPRWPRPAAELGHILCRHVATSP